MNHSPSESHPHSPFCFTHQPKVAQLSSSSDLLSHPETLRLHTHFAKKALAEARALSPKRSQMLDELGPTLESWHSQMRDAYEEITGRRVDFQQEFLHLGDENAFCIPTLSTLVISSDLLREMVSEAFQREDAFDLPLFKSMYWMVRGHEMGHQHIGAFRDDPLLHRASQVSHGNHSYSPQELQTLGEIRAFNLSLERECDEFSLKLAKAARISPEQHGRGLELLLKIQRRLDYALYEQSVDQTNTNESRRISQKRHKEEMEMMSQLNDSPDKKYDDYEMDQRRYDDMTSDPERSPAQAEESAVLDDDDDDDRVSGRHTNRELPSHSRGLPTLFYSHPDTSSRIRALEERQGGVRYPISGNESSFAQASKPTKPDLAKFHPELFPTTQFPFEIRRYSPNKYLFEFILNAAIAHNIFPDGSYPRKSRIFQGPDGRCSLHWSPTDLEARQLSEYLEKNLTSMRNVLFFPAFLSGLIAGNSKKILGEDILHFEKLEDFLLSSHSVRNFANVLLSFHHEHGLLPVPKGDNLKTLFDAVIPLLPADIVVDLKKLQRKKWSKDSSQNDEVALSELEETRIKVLSHIPSFNCLSFLSEFHLMTNTSESQDRQEKLLNFLSQEPSLTPLLKMHLDDENIPVDAISREVRRDPVAAQLFLSYRGLFHHMDFAAEDPWNSLHLQHEIVNLCIFAEHYLSSWDRPWKMGPGIAGSENTIKSEMLLKCDSGAIADFKSRLEGSFQQSGVLGICEVLEELEQYPTLFVDQSIDEATVLSRTVASKWYEHYRHQLVSYCTDFIVERSRSGTFTISDINVLIHRLATSCHWLAENINWGEIFLMTVENQMPDWEVFSREFVVLQENLRNSYIPLKKTGAQLISGGINASFDLPKLLNTDSVTESLTRMFDALEELRLQSPSWDLYTSQDCASVWLANMIQGGLSFEMLTESYASLAKVNNPHLALAAYLLICFHFSQYLSMSGTQIVSRDAVQTKLRSKGKKKKVPVKNPQTLIQETLEIILSPSSPPNCFANAPQRAGDDKDRRHVESFLQKFLETGIHDDKIPNRDSIIARIVSLAGDDTYPYRLEALSALNDVYLTSAMSLTGFSASVFKNNYRKDVQLHTKEFDGKDGLLFHIPIHLIKGPENDSLFLMLSQYADTVLRDPHLRGSLLITSICTLPTSASLKREWIPRFDWMKVAGKGASLRAHFAKDATALSDAVSRQVFTTEEDQPRQAYEPVEGLKVSDVVIGQYYQLMNRCYEQSVSEGFFTSMTPRARFISLTTSIFPIGSYYRDHALREHIEDLTLLSIEECFELRDAYSDVRYADDVSTHLVNRLREEGRMDEFRESMSRTSAGGQLLSDLKIEDISSAPTWKRELYDLLLLYPYPSFRRDELLEALENKRPGVDEGNCDLPATKADMHLIQQWKVHTGTLRKDPLATERMLELEMLVSGIQKLDRKQRIDLLIFYLGIELENDTKREIEGIVRKKFPSFAVSGSMLSQREMNHILLEVFEGKISGVFTPPSDRDKTPPDRFLKEIAQKIVNKGDVSLQLKLSNIIYRIFQKSHWRKRLRITHEVLKLSGKEKLTMPEFVTQFICSLGAVFIKASQQEGQKSYIPAEFRDALLDVFDQAPLPPKSEMLEVVDESLRSDDRGGLDLFEGGLLEPLACASTAVVYRAVLKDPVQIGARSVKDVAIKVIKPTAVHEMESDVELIRDLIKFVNHNPQIFGIHLPVNLADEIRASLLHQMDLREELLRQQRYSTAVDLLKPALATQSKFGNCTVTEIISRSDLHAEMVTVYELVRGIPLTDSKKIERFADFYGMEVKELRAWVYRVLAMVQLGTVYKADHYQADPNEGNALLTVSFVPETPESLVTKVHTAVRRICYGLPADVELSARESRSLHLDLKLLDFGAIEAVPQQYRELLQHIVWSLLSGDVKKTQRLIFEMHITSHFSQGVTDVTDVPHLSIKGFEKDLMSYLDRHFRDAISELFDSLSTEDLSRDRFVSTVKELLQKQDFGPVFQDFLELLDQHQIRIPNEIMSLLKSFRIGSYIFKNIEVSDVMDEFKRLTPAPTIEKLRSEGVNVFKRVIGEKAFGLIKSGVRTLQKVVDIFRMDAPTEMSLLEIVMERLKDCEISEWFKHLRPSAVRTQSKVSDADIDRYISSLGLSHVGSGRTSVSDRMEYAVGIAEIKEAYRVDFLPIGTIMKYKAYGAEKSILLTGRGFLGGMSQSKVECVKDDGTVAVFILDFILKKSIVLMPGQKDWMRGDQLIKVHRPGEEISDPDIAGITVEIPENIQLALQSLVDDSKKPVSDRESDDREERNGRKMKRRLES